MTNATTLFLVPWLALALSGCSGGGGNGEPPANPAPNCTMGTNLKADEANNYQFSSTLTFPPIKVQPKTELSFEWSGITKDFLGHPVSANDLAMISVLAWALPRADLESMLNADTLPQSALIGLPLTLTTDGTTAGIPAGATSAKTLQFTLNGTPIVAGTSVSPELVLGYFDADNYPPEGTTYTMIAASGNVVGQGSRMIQSFLTDKGSTNTTVKMTSSSTQLTWKANLHSLVPIAVPAGEKALTFDWTDGITTNALGGKFDPTSVTHVLVGHYSETVGQLEGKFLDIQLIATDLYEADVPAGTSIDLSTLTTKGNKSFAGIDNTGTWLLGLQCGVCRNPAPWYLTILKTMDSCK